MRWLGKACTVGYRCCQKIGPLGDPEFAFDEVLSTQVVVRTNYLRTDASLTDSALVLPAFFFTCSDNLFLPLRTWQAIEPSHQLLPLCGIKVAVFGGAAANKACVN